MSSIAANTANTIIEEQLDRHLEELEKAINGDVVAFLGPIEFGVDSLIRDAVEYRKNLNDKIRVYYKLLLDYMMRRSHPGVIHTIGHYFPV